MFRIFIVFFISISAVSLTSYPSAIGTASAKQDSTINAAQEMIAWQQDYVQLTTLLTSLFDSENLSFLYDESTFETAESIDVAIKAYSEKRATILSNYDQSKKLLSPPERWNIQKSFFDKTERRLFNAMTEQYNSLDDFREDMALASDFSTLFNSAVQDDNEEILNEILARQFDASARVVKAENKQIDAFLLAIPTDNANYQFHQIMKAGNIAGLYEVEWNQHSLNNPNDLTKRNALGKKMERSVSNIPALIKKARKNITSQQRNFNKVLRNSSITPQQMKFVQGAIKANASFEESLSIEEELFQNYLLTIALMTTDKTDEEQEVQTDEIDLAFYDLIDRRIAVIQSRMQAMSQ